MNTENQLFYQADGSQGGDPQAKNIIDPAHVGAIFASRILAINPTDTKEKSPLDPERPRNLNYPTVDNSPLQPEYCGHKTLKSLFDATVEQFKAQNEKNKALKNNAPPQFLKAQIATSTQLVDLRIFSAKALNPSPAANDEGYITCEIWRKDKVTSRGGGVMDYGRRTVTETAPVAKEAVTATATTPAKPVGV